MPFRETKDKSDDHFKMGFPYYISKGREYEKYQNTGLRRLRILCNSPLTVKSRSKLDADIYTYTSIGNVLPASFHRTDFGRFAGLVKMT